VGVKNFCTKPPKDTPLRQIWSNKLFGVCGSDVVLKLYGGEKKKYARIAIGNSMSSITLHPLPRCRDVLICAKFIVKMSLIFAQYFDYCAIILKGQGVCKVTKCLIYHNLVSSH